MTALTRVRFAGYAWTIEHYHRGIKQYCGVERAQVRRSRPTEPHWFGATRLFMPRAALPSRESVGSKTKTTIIRSAANRPSEIYFYTYVPQLQ